jgi:hypothetical protein
MRRLLVLLAGGLGLRAILRRRRPERLPAPSPAEGLRAKLDETKVVEPEPEAASPDEDARRADVHARARTAIEELREPK